MAHRGDTCVYVETNFDTRLVVPIHSEDTVSTFKEMFCREHKKHFPEIGDIQISAMKIERENRFYHFFDTMIWSYLFEDVHGNWSINVDAVKVENGDLVTVQADAPSVSMDTEQSVRALSLPDFTSEVSRPDTAQKFGSEDSFLAVQNVQQSPSSASGFTQEKLALSQSDLDVLVTSLTTSQFLPSGSNMYKGSKEASLIVPDKLQAALEHEAVKENVTVDADEAKPAKSTKKRKSKKAKTTSEVASSSHIAEPLKVAGLCDGKFDEETACKDFEDSAAEREIVQNVTIDVDEAKPVKGTEKRKSKKAKSTSEVVSGAEIAEPLKVAGLCDGKFDEETACKDLVSKVEYSAAKRESVQNVTIVADEAKPAKDTKKRKSKKAKTTSDSEVASSSHIAEPLKVAELCDGKFDEETSCKDLVSKLEDSAAERESVQNVTIDNDEAKPAKSTKKRKSKKAETTSEVTSGSHIAEPLKVAELSDRKLDEETACKDLTSKIEDSAAAERVSVQNVQHPSNSFGFLQEKLASSQSDLDVLVTSLTSQFLPSGSNMYEGSKEAALEHEAVKENDTVDADEAKPAKSTKKRKSKKAKTTSDSDVDSGAHIAEPLKVAELCDKTACKDLASKVGDSAAERESVQDVQPQPVPEIEISDKVFDNLGSKEAALVVPDNLQAAVEHEAVKENVTIDADGAKSTKKRKSKKAKTTSEVASGSHIAEPLKISELCDGKFDEETAFKDLASKVEGSAVERESVQKDDVKESLSLSRCSCEDQRARKKLLVFDLNGILADVLRSRGESAPDGKSNRPVFIRPFLASFLDFCFERFDVGIWSSRRVKLKYMTNLVMGNQAKDLLFSFDQHMCVTTEFKTLENTAKPLFLKDLRRVWNHLGKCSICGKPKYDETNTLLVDDSPAKALCNPPHTGIFPYPYKHTDQEDSALGRNGEIRKYLERLVDAEDVQKFVSENPIGQAAISETHESWEFYSEVIEKYK